MPRTFDPALWRQAQLVLGELLDLPVDLRQPHLEAMDLPPALETRVRRLLEACDRPGPLDGQLNIRLQE